VRVEGGRIVARRRWLLRPQVRRFLFSHIHGVTWSRVRWARSFEEIWPELSLLLASVSFIAAHNARFDRSVLLACCRVAQVSLPRAPFLCTLQLARRTWGIFPTMLPAVCHRLGIPLHHHDPVSDAEASACIVLKAWEASGFRSSDGAHARFTA
jgi:DNA polymerase-3 subunit epsilon